MFLLATRGIWLLDEVSFGSRWLLVSPLTCIGKRLWTTTHSPKLWLHSATGSFLFFCALLVWFLHSKDFCSFLICVLCQVDMRYRGSSLLGEMLAWNGGRPLMFAEGGNAAKTLELGFLWTGSRSAVKEKYILERTPHTLEPRCLSAKPSAGTWIEITRGARSAVRLLTILFWFCRGSSYFC